MAVRIAMLRGVNVGAAHRIKMDDLREVYESMGFGDVTTLGQSGNVVFRASRTVSAARLEEVFEKRFGFRAEVLLRTAAEMRQALARNPFPGAEGSKVAVWFLSEDPNEEARRKALALETPPEKLYLEGREVYIWFPNGMARPKLNVAALGKLLGGGTARNWNVVTKLAELAESI